MSKARHILRRLRLVPARCLEQLSDLVLDDSILDGFCACDAKRSLPTANSSANAIWLATGSQAHTLETKSGCRAAFRSPNSASSHASCCYSLLFVLNRLNWPTNFQLSTAVCRPTEAINKSTRDMTYDGQAIFVRAVRASSGKRRISHVMFAISWAGVCTDIANHRATVRTSLPP